MSDKKLKLPDNSMTDAEIRGFMKNYEMKNLTYSELYSIYKKHAFEPNFRTTLFAAMALIIAPSVTNIYYMYRPNATMARIAPYAVPIVCAVQYFAALTYDIQNFCFKESDDSETVRRKILNLSSLEGWDSRFKKLGDEIEYYSKSIELQK